MLTWLLLAALTAPPAPADTSRDAVRPVEQRLELELDPAAVAWSGSLLAKLEVRDATRRLRLALGRVAVSHVVVEDARGRVELAWGIDTTGGLLVETSRPIVPGRAVLDVAFTGGWSPAAPGITRNAARNRVALERGAGLDVPAWPRGPATPWTLMVHAPAAFEVRASGRRTGIDEAVGWRTWNFRTSRALPADSLRVTVRPRRPARP